MADKTAAPAPAGAMEDLRPASTGLPDDPALARVGDMGRRVAWLADLHQTLGFRIKSAVNGVQLKVFTNGGVTTATDDEQAMYDMIVGPLAAVPAVKIGEAEGAGPILKLVPPIAVPAADHRDWLLMALSSCLTAQTDMFEILRDEEAVVPGQIYAREVVENLACALQSATGLAVQTSPLDDDQRDMLGQLQAAVAHFLEAWA